MESGEGEHQDTVSLGFDASMFTTGADGSTRQFKVDERTMLFSSGYFKVLPFELRQFRGLRVLLLEWLPAGLWQSGCSMKNLLELLPTGLTL